MSIKKALLLVAAVGIFSSAAHAEPKKSIFTPNEDLQAPQTVIAELAALADGITTYQGISSNKMREANPLMPKTKKGVIAATAIKIAGLALVDAYAKPRTRDFTMVFAAASYTTASVHNALRTNGMKSKSALPIALAAGIGTYFLTRKVAEKHNITFYGTGFQYERKF